MDRVHEILQNDKYNIDLWNSVLNRPSTVEVSRYAFDAFLEVFPTAARYWKTYIEREISLKNFHHVELLFNRCLFSCLDVDLWRTYITYIRTVKKGTANELRDINTAYEFVIKNIGMDVNSISIWCDHIAFLKNELQGVPEEERKKAIRAVYHLALVTPMSGVDQIWREYDSWEHINDPTLAKGLLAGLYQQHQNAKSCCLHRKRLKRSILLGMLAKPPYGEATANERDYLQVIHWSKLIDYEQTNPQKLTPVQLEERVVFTFKQALMYLRFYPEIWDPYAKYLFKRHTLEDAVNVYEKAISALKGNLTMNFLYAEFLESQKKTAEARVVYENLLNLNRHPLAYVQFQRFSRRSESKEAARKVFVEAKKNEDCTFHIYLSSAYIEHFANKETKIALKILDLGLARFGNEPEFVSRYLDFLEFHSDINNMREIYERVLAQMDHRRGEIIWEKYMEFEGKHCSSLKELNALDERRTQILDLPQTKVQMNLMKQHSFVDLSPCPAEFSNIMEKVLYAKVQEIPVETISALKKTSKLKSYTFKGVTKFFQPSVESMIEVKPGVDFLSPSTLKDKSGENIPLPQLPVVIKKLLTKLPHSTAVQGIPIENHFLCRHILNSGINLAQVLSSKSQSGFDSSLTVVKRARPEIQGDLFSQRRSRIE